MKKYILMALLPFCGSILSTELQPVLNAAYRAATSGTADAANLSTTLTELIKFAKNGTPNAYEIAVGHIKTIDTTLQKMRSEQYTSTWSNICWLFGRNPASIHDIDKQIDEVNNAHRSMITDKYSKYMSDILHIGTSIASNAAVFAAGAIVLYLYQNKGELSNLSFWKAHLPAMPTFRK